MAIKRINPDSIYPGIYLFEYKEWSYDDLKNATVSKATNQDSSDKSLAYEKTHEFIRQKFNELTHNDGVEIHNYLLMENLNSDEVLEIKTLSYLFLEIPFARAQGLYKSLLSPKSAIMRAYTLKALKKTTTLKNNSIISLFTDVEVANELAKEIQLAEKFKTPGFSLIISGLQALINHVSYLSINYLDITTAYSESLDKALAGAYKRARAASEQHTIIPPIIYEKIYINMSIK